MEKICGTSTSLQNFYIMNTVGSGNTKGTNGRIHLLDKVIVCKDNWGCNACVYKLTRYTFFVK